MRHASLLAIALAVGTPALAQEGDNLKAGDVAFGGDLFASYCTACHGAEGRGDGPMAPVLMVVPADLTQLSASNGGVFPVVRVVQQIDGRDPLLAHGGEMPLFGDFFAGEDIAIRSEAGQPIMTSRPIADLMAWLETIQE